MLLCRRRCLTGVGVRCTPCARVLLLHLRTHALRLCSMDLTLCVACFLPCSVYNAGHEISHRYNEVRGSAGTALWVKGAALRRPCKRAGFLAGSYNVSQTTCLYACPWIPAQVLFPAEPGKKGRRGGVA